jgi:hypothetical protein
MNSKSVRPVWGAQQQLNMDKRLGSGKYPLLGVLAVISTLLFLNGVSFAAALLPVPVSTVPSSTGDTNPYGIIFVQGSPGGSLEAGDILVANFNNSSGVMGLGRTIVDIRNGVQLSTPFYTAPPAAEGLTLALQQMGTLIVVGNVRLNSNGTAGAGALTILNSSGRTLNEINDPHAKFIDGPWGLAIQTSGNSAIVFVSNVLNGTVWRLYGTFSTTTGLTLTSETQVAGGYATENMFPTSINGPAGLAYDAMTDILFIASEQDNEIFCVGSASTISNTTKGTLVYSDPDHLHGPTGLILLQNGDLLTANDDGVNVNPAEPSELVEFTPSTPSTPDGTFVTQYSVDPATGGAFGIASSVNTTDNNTLLVYVDDNTATLSVLSLFFK